jgi:glycosyltransferase involved in cell wall biosynthesis
MSQPKVSVVVTCYNLGAFLEEALASVPQRPDVETIVVDDGSTDQETVRVLDGLDQQHFTVIRQPNMGLAKARNNGVRAARGRYIIPLDADNRLRTAMVDMGIAVLDAQPEVDVVYGDAQYFGERDARWTVGPFDFKLLIERNRIDACAVFRKALWERAGGYDEHMPVMGYEDWDFWLRSTVAGARFHYEETIFFDYRVRGGSMLTNTMKNRPLLVRYMFAKRELNFLEGLRQAYLDAEERERKRPVLTGRVLLRMLWARLRGRMGGGPHTNG